MFVGFQTLWFISCNTCDDFLQLVFYYFHFIGSFLGSDQAAIFKGKHVSFACELETSGRNKKGESIMSNEEIKECLLAEGLGTSFNRIASCSFC